MFKVNNKDTRTMPNLVLAFLLLTLIMPAGTRGITFFAAFS